MIQVITGEDFVKSRRFFVELKDNYRQKGYEIKEIIPEQITEFYQSWKDQPNLFGQKICFFTQNLSKKLINKKEFKKIINSIAEDKKTIVVIWEENKSPKELSYPKNTQITEFKPETNIFKFLDGFYPDNKKFLLKTLAQISETNDEGFIFYMLVKRVKQLLAVKLNLNFDNLQPWQLKKIRSQGYFWSVDRLITVYENLHRIDLLTKTSDNPFSLINSLEILICYLL